jgi:TPR repeat protein
MYEYGNGAKRNNAKALKYYRKACDLKSAIGCKDYKALKS